MRSWPLPDVPVLPGTPPALRLYDTAAARTAALDPAGTVGMYVCGITPYDTTHLGHAATYLTFDLVYRQLRDAGHDVHYVQNVTDIDDPLFERAERDGVDWRELGDGEIEAYRTDMEALRVIPPRDFVGVVETIDEVIGMVGELLEAGKAYRIDDDPGGYADIYFPVDATDEFGYESGYDRATMDELFAERGGDPDRPGKRHPLDALLWRAERPDEPAWDAPFGRGRPGWHIECSAIARNRLGMGFDIQGGGSDLVFPHHEYSASHAEAAAGAGRFARFYVHAGMIGLDGVKMSKSLGNLVRVRDLLADGVDPTLVRVGLFDGHYRAERSWSGDVLAHARARHDSWREAASRGAGAESAALISSVRERLADDLDTPGALELVDAWAAATNSGERTDPGAGRAVGTMLDALLGITL